MALRQFLLAIVLGLAGWSAILYAVFGGGGFILLFLILLSIWLVSTNG